MVDYLIVSTDILHTISHFCMASLETYSDHCPLMFSVEHTFISQVQEERQKECATPLQYLAQPLTWNEEVCVKFKRTLEENVTINHIKKLEEVLNKVNVNAAAEKMTTLLKMIVEECCNTHKPNRSTHHIAPTTDKTRIFPRNKWFDDVCKEQKRTLSVAKKLFLEKPMDSAVREEFYRQRKAYKKLI